MTINAQDRLILALDLPSIQDAQAMVDQFDGLVRFYKVGLTLQLAAGLQFIQPLLARGNQVFLDYKYFDVEETIRKAVSQAAQLGVTFLTIHGHGRTIQAAVDGRGSSNLKLLAVTVLTSLDASDIAEMGYPCAVEDLVIHRARKAAEAGCDGVVASGLEAARIREAVGDKLLIVTPGIRPEGASGDEQKRRVTPAGAIRSGADYLVVGRPITHQPDPRAAAERILEEMQEAFDGR
ncbi:MAG: orotidine-5'-phosphate decarboxylase [Acidobacteria bacterium]|nr:orotidine-5'-phosphate decarboxylase [Acidobacteriota bacterium]